MKNKCIIICLLYIPCIFPAATIPTPSSTRDNAVNTADYGTNQFLILSGAQATTLSRLMKESLQMLTIPRKQVLQHNTSLFDFSRASPCALEKYLEITSLGGLLLSNQMMQTHAQLRAHEITEIMQHEFEAYVERYFPFPISADDHIPREIREKIITAWKQRAISQFLDHLKQCNTEIHFQYHALKLLFPDI